MPARREQVEARFRGRRVTVVGLGRFGGGVGAVRWLARAGAKITISDKAPAESLAESVAAIEGCGATLHLGGHREADFLEADCLVVSPAIPPKMPLLRRAAERGAAITTEINLFLEQCPARVVGITGSVGKSTTTAMAAAVLAARHTVHMGGNIGVSLLAELEAIRPEHLVVLELSSFQLEHTSAVEISPHAALVTNLQPNHLDRHGTMDAYAEAKKNLFRFQHPQDVLILNAACDATRRWAEEAKGQVRFFEPDPACFDHKASSPNARTASPDDRTASPDDRAASASERGRCRVPFCDEERAGPLPCFSEPFALRIPGAHNQANAQAAWAIGRWFGVPRKDAARALESFPGLPHRLQFVAEIQGVRYYNDSKCTTPAGAIVAMEAFEPGRSVIILGGYDKGVSFAELGRVAAERAKAVVAIGATSEQIAEAVADAAEELPGRPEVELADSLEDAVVLARHLAAPGDAVLLSPACASYDMFTNYEHRGEAFCRLVCG